MRATGSLSAVSVMHRWQLVRGEVELRVPVPFNTRRPGVPLELLSPSSISLSADPKLTSPELFAPQVLLLLLLDIFSWNTGLFKSWLCSRECSYCFILLGIWLRQAKKSRGKKFPLRCRRNEKEKYPEHITLSEIMIWSFFCEISAPSGQSSEKRAENY